MPVRRREDGRGADRRVRRTERSIREAFFELTERGGRVSVKELCERADINKTTFYQHYHDMADLERKLEDSLVGEFLDEIGHPDYFVSKDQGGIYEVARAFARHRADIGSRWLESRMPILVSRVEDELERRIAMLHPEMAQDRGWRVMVSFLVRGSFEAFFAHLGEGDVEELVAAINDLRQRLVRDYEPLEVANRRRPRTD